ncbi:hypothetical protein SAMN02746089_02816, partial [Caldanaerobius fijiensis DSM 17918]
MIKLERLSQNPVLRPLNKFMGGIKMEKLYSILEPYDSWWNDEGEE